MSKKSTAKPDYKNMSTKELEELAESSNWRVAMAAADELERRETVEGSKE